MTETSDKSKRIARNTMLLYFRMIFLMLISLYTSRMILQVLGVTDFGIYNVVGGVVTMLGFVSGSLSGATSRFITFELGKGVSGDVKRVFRCAVTVHYILSFIVFVLAETIGIWFVLNKMVIPDDRIIAALWVYQCSVGTLIVSILSVPYNALIIAHERMDAFAYISIVEALAKLLLVALIVFTPFDSLITFAINLFVIQIIIRLLYTLYCSKQFPETSSKWLWDKKISSSIAKYAGWTMNGNLAVVGYTQGINILLNLFFGPVVNAARGISVQVQSAVLQFFSNFQTAVRPQITKSYAQGNLDYMHSLVLNSSRYSFYLIIFIALPILINTEYILTLWLGQIPEHTVIFTRLMIVACMNESFRGPTIIAIHATGDLKKFQMIEGTLLLTIIPVAYLLLKFYHISPEGVVIVYLMTEIITQFVRVWIVYPRISLSRKMYFKEILNPIFKVVLILLLLAMPLSSFSATNFLELLLNSLICCFGSFIVIWFIGINTLERETITTKFKKYLEFS